MWERPHALLLAELQAAGGIEWSRAVAEGSHVQAKKGSETGPSPVDRARTGPKHHLLSTRRGSRSPGRLRAATATTSPS